MSVNREVQFGDLIARFYTDTDTIEDSIDNNPMLTADVTFQVTDACNLCCSYCYQINKGQHRMSFETAKKFIDMLLDNDETTRLYMDTRAKKGVTIDFIGGEPFLEVELMD